MVVPRPAPTMVNAGYPRQPMGVVSPQHMQVSPTQQMAQAMPQPPFKGTLPPGTRVQIGSITVTVKRYLSEGGFAHVYLVTTSSPIPMPASAGSTSSSTPSMRGEYTHVLKRMAVPDKEALAEVRGEVEVHKLLRNQPHIVHFIEASATSLPNGGYEVFILMEFCAGGGIIDLMNARLRDRLREDEVLRIFSHVCSGLAVMHHLDPPMMHRDLKVENILLAPSNTNAQSLNSAATAAATATYKLCDFGSAAPVLSRRAPKSIDEVRRLEADLNKHTTLQYRAPEMVDPYQRRIVDEKADIWALGVLLYKLCYYTTPFEENGGGPLAILNARYRIPPSPPYSQKLKALIGSLLQEQSTVRPTIDEVIIRTHALLGTTPPASAVHYVQQAAAGKIAKPLATSVSSSGPKASSEVTVNRIRDDGADLIRLGPTEAEAAKEQAEALRKQSEAITPMRRGRPPKGGTAGTVVAAATQALSAKSGSTGENPLPSRSDKSAWEDFGRSTSFGKLAGSADASVAGAKSLGDFGFADSFRPHLSPPNVSSGPHSRPLSAQRDTPLDHSPVLPGFNPTPSPQPSPLPPAAVSSTSDQVSNRFPTVEELDAKYASSPSSRSPVHAAGQSDRETLGLVASRFEQTASSTPSRQLTSTSPVAIAEPLSRKWPPVGATSGSLRGPRASDSKPSFRHSIMVPPGSSASDVIGQGDQSPLPAARPSLKPSASTGLLDEGKEVTRVSKGGPTLPPTMPPRSAGRLSDLTADAAADHPPSKEYRSPARFGSPDVRPTGQSFPTAGDGADFSSGDDGPEEVGARSYSQSNQGLPKRVAKAWEEQIHQTVVSPPVSAPVSAGRVKTPAWAMSPSDSTHPIPSRERRQSSSARIDTAKALYENPPPVPAIPRSNRSSPQHTVSKGMGAAERARARAPAWDTDEPSLDSSSDTKPSTTQSTGLLVDLEDRKEVPHLLDRVDTPEPVPVNSVPLAESYAASNGDIDDDSNDDEQPEDPERRAVHSDQAPRRSAPVAAPKPLRAAPSRNVSVGGMLERYESIGAGGRAPVDTSSPSSVAKGRHVKESSASDFARRFPDISNEVDEGTTKAVSTHSDAVEQEHTANADERASPLLSKAKPALPPKSMYASVVPARTMGFSSSSSHTGVSSAASRAEVQGSETVHAPPTSLPRSQGAAPGKKAATLKPWEREAAEAEDNAKTGIVRANGLAAASPDGQAQERASEGNPVRPGVSPEQRSTGTTNIITPTTSNEQWKLSTLRGASAQETEARSTSVSNLISQWQANAESSAPGWGRIGGRKMEGDREKERLAEGLVGVNREAAEVGQKKEMQRERLPGRDV